MAKIWHFLSTTILLSVLFFLAVEMQWDFFRERELGGEFMRKKLKPLTFENLLSGEFQQAFDAWFSENVGFRNTMVRLDNQINYKVFSDLAGGVVTRNILGEGGMLYQKAYVKSIDGYDSVGDEKLRETVELLAKLQNYLDSKGKAFLVVIGATKASLYPEFIPPAYRASESARRVTNYQRLLPMLEEGGIRVFDAQGEYSKKRDQVDFSYFAPSAAHWNDVMACEVGRTITERIAKQLSKTGESFTCEPIHIKKPKSTDLDLLRLTNLYDSKKLQLEAAYPETVPIRPEGAFKPRVLLVGDSFLWPVIRFLDWHKVFKSIDMHYYNNANHHFPGGVKTNLRTGKEKWRRMLDAQDAVVLFASPSRLHSLGHGYLDEAERFLD